MTDKERIKIFAERDKYCIIENAEQDKVHKHHKLYSFSGGEQVGKILPGDKFLYEEFIDSGYDYFPEEYRNKKVITYPKIGIFLSVDIIDQALEVEYVPYQRVYGWNKKIKGYASLNSHPNLLKSTIIWSDDLYVYGHWSTLPGWKELKQYYYKSWYFKQTKAQNRDRRINTII